MRLILYIIICLCFVIKTNPALQAQAWSMKFEDTSQVSLHGLSSFHAYQNGDILIIQHTVGVEGCILSRMSRDLSTVLSSAKLYIGDVVGGDIHQEGTNFWSSFAYIDSEDRVWMELWNAGSTSQTRQHNYLIGLDVTFEVVSSFRFIFNSSSEHFIYQAVENTALGHIDFYSEKIISSGAQPYQLNKIRCNYDGNCELVPVVALPANSRTTFPSTSMLGSKVLLNQTHSSDHHNLNCLILDVEEQSMSTIEFNTGDFSSEIAAKSVRNFWLSPEEFVFFMFFSDSLIAVRYHTNGTILWSKLYQLHAGIKLTYNTIGFYAVPMNFATVDDQKVYLNGSIIDYSFEGPGLQVQYIIDLEDGSIETPSWSTLSAFDSGSGSVSKRINERFYSSFLRFIPVVDSSYKEVVLLHDDPASDLNCFRLDICPVQVDDIDLRMIGQTEQNINVHELDTLTSDIWFQFTTAPISYTHELYCEDREIVSDEISFEHDQLFLCSKDTLVVNIENLIGVEIINFTDRNDSLIPTRDGLNSFLFPFDIIKDSVLYVEIERLGCIWMDSIEINFPTSPEYEIDRQYTICMDSLLELQLPEIEDHLAIWPDSSSTLMTNEPGYHFFNIYSEFHPCEYPDSIFLSLDELPELMMDTHFEFCPELGVFEPPLPEGSFTSYLWYNPFNEPVDSPEITQAGSWLLKVNKGLCTDTLLIQFDALECSACQIYIPNAFTPNSDLINDSWGIYSDCIDNISNFNLQIFDRWGNLIFQTDQPNRFWDGSKSGQPVNPGVYVYSITFSVLDPLGSRDIEEKGSLTLLR